VYDKDGVEKFNGPINIKYFENEYILDLNSLTGNRIKPDYSTLLQLETVATFKKTKVRVTDWYNMAVTYVTDFDPETGTGGTIHNDVSTVQRGQKYIHTFWTEEQNVLTPDYVGIKVAVTEDTVPPEDKTIGYGKDLQIAKISLKSNINSFVRGFNASNFAMIPYKHNKPRLPNVLDLYLRLLPKISVKFYLPTGFLVSLPNKNVYQGGTCVLEYDAENVTGNSLSFDIKRDMTATSMNMLTGQFYYNETGSGTPADVIFEHLSEMFSTDEKKTVIVSPITFVNTTFSIRMTARRVVGLILNYYLPKFVDAYTLEETFPALNKGGYLGSRRTNYSDDSDLNGYGWINFANSTNAVQSEDVRKETSFVE